MFEERITLGYDTDLAGNDRTIEAVNGHPARGGLVQASDDAEERGFAATGGPENTHHLPLHPARHDDIAHLSDNAVQHRAAVILESDVVDLQQCLAKTICACHYFRSNVSDA